MRKELYTEAELEIVAFEAEDIITASGPVHTGDESDPDEL